jgi:hypothetical protein
MDDTHFGYKQKSLKKKKHTSLDSGLSCALFSSLVSFCSMHLLLLVDDAAPHVLLHLLLCCCCCCSCCWCINCGWWVLIKWVLSAAFVVVVVVVPVVGAWTVSGVLLKWVLSAAFVVVVVVGAETVGGGAHQVSIISSIVFPVVWCSVFISCWCRSSCRLP